jgi:ribosomal 50S subunit-recycling heat shock protein
VRLDSFLSDTGIIKRRTVAKEMADGGRIKLNGQTAKAAKTVSVDDIIEITGKRHVRVKVKEIPRGNVRKDARQDYFEILSDTRPDDFDLG